MRINSLESLRSLKDKIELKASPIMKDEPLECEDILPEETEENFSVAAYNFVPMPKQLVLSPLGEFINCALKNNQDIDPKKKIALKTKKYKEFIDKEGKFSGEIALTFLVKTPLCVGDGKGNFFSPFNKKPIIPGSTLRGLIKNILKIITCGSMKVGEDVSSSPYTKKIDGQETPKISIRSKNANHLPNDNLPEGLRADDFYDFADAMFGSRELWGSRLTFENCEFEEGFEFVKVINTKSLTAPEPLACNMYLDMNKAPKNSYGAKYIWNETNTPIRGYKLYWHRNQNWDGRPVYPANSQPINIGAKFNANIRYTNLTQVELGALLSALSYGMKQGSNYDGCFKMGMGKALGLGSVQIEKLDLKNYNPQSRYNQLFGDKGWEDGAAQNNKEDFINAFNDYMKNRKLSNYDKIIEVLRFMLDWSNVNNPKWNQYVTEMEAGDKRFGKPLIDPLKIRDLIAPERKY